MLLQLQYEGHAAVDGLNVDDVSAISLRKGGNSAAAAIGISEAHRRVHGRWRAGSHMHDREYLALHRRAFNDLASSVLLSKHGE